MKPQTKIVVIRFKELVIAASLAVIIIALLVMFYLAYSNSGDEPLAPAHKYTAGVYSSSVVLGSNPVDLRVTVDEDDIKNIELVNLSESVTTMYPLIQTTFEDIKKAVMENDGAEGISYPSENKYTTTMLLNAIDNALEKARS